MTNKVTNKPQKLTAKQERFVEEYLVDFNATQAAIRAGYSAKTAKSIGQENLTKPVISAAIAEHRASLTQKTALTRELIVEGLLREALYTGKNASHGARVAAWTQLGRIQGVYIEDHAQRGDGLMAMLDTMSGDELESMESLLNAALEQGDNGATDERTLN